jgi:uncharacterized protein
MYADGQGDPKNEAKAFEWFEKAATQGAADALFNLGWRYSNGGAPDATEERESLPDNVIPMPRN